MLGPNQICYHFFASPYIYKLKPSEHIPLSTLVFTVNYTVRSSSRVCSWVRPTSSSGARSPLPPPSASRRLAPPPPSGSPRHSPPTAGHVSLTSDCWTRESHLWLLDTWVSPPTAGHVSLTSDCWTRESHLRLLDTWVLPTAGHLAQAYSSWQTFHIDDIERVWTFFLLNLVYTRYSRIS